MTKLLVTKVFLWFLSLIRVLVLVQDLVKSRVEAPVYSMESAPGSLSAIKASLQDQKCVKVSNTSITTRTLSWASLPSPKIPRGFQYPIVQGNTIINIEELQGIAVTQQVFMVLSVLSKTSWLPSNFTKELTIKAQEQRTGIRNSEKILHLP